MLLDDANKNRQLLQVKLLHASNRAASDGGEGRYYLLGSLGRSAIQVKAITWGKNVTHFRPCVLKIDMIASITV
jgi:hypothetical protein